MRVRVTMVMVMVMVVVMVVVVVVFVTPIMRMLVGVLLPVGHAILCVVGWWWRGVFPLEIACSACFTASITRSEACSSASR